MKLFKKTIRAFSRRGKLNAAAIGIFVAAAVPALVWAADNTQLSQTIAAGTLVTEIRDQNGAAVVSPSVPFSSVAYPFECLTGAPAPDGILGTNTERLYVDNPGAANAGWNLNVAATGGGTALWTDGGTGEQYDYNDPTTTGCTDGADADTEPGQLSIDPSGAAINAEGVATTTGLSQGSASAFDEATISSINLIAAAAGSDDYGRWYFTDIDLTQTIPQEQAAGSYTLGLTIDVVAN